MRLAKSGQRAQANEIKKLPKPTVPAHAVNRLARERGSQVKALLKAAGELRKAQERGVGAGEDLRTKVQAERRAVRSLVESARDVLADEGRPPSDSTLARVEKTLHAAAADADSRELLEQGRLTKELEPPGFEALAGLALPQAGGRSRPSSSRDGGRRRSAALKRRVREAREKARERHAEAEDAEREADHAAGVARKARARADAAQRALEKAEAELKRES